MKKRPVKSLAAIFIASLLYLSSLCPNAIGAELFAGAAGDAVTRAVASLECWRDSGTCKDEKQTGQKGPKIDKKLAVWEMGGDENSIIWNRLQTAIVKSEYFDVYTMADTKDAKKILKEHGRQLKYENRYDPNTLVALGKLIAPKSIVVGKVESAQVSKTGAEIILIIKLLDLTTGQVVWSEISSGKGKVQFATTSWTWRISVCLAILALCIFFVFWANWQSPRFLPCWVVMAGIVGGTFWFLIGKYL